MSILKASAEVIEPQEEGVLRQRGLKGLWKTMKLSSFHSVAIDLYDESSEQEKPAKSVVFGEVEIREYERVVGDQNGLEVPLAIGWRYKPDPVRVSVDTHSERDKNPVQQLSARDRIEILKTVMSFTDEKIYDAELERLNQHMDERLAMWDKTEEVDECEEDVRGSRGASAKRVFKNNVKKLVYAMSMLKTDGMIHL